MYEICCMEKKTLMGLPSLEMIGAESLMPKYLF